ncbi:MAG: penicillin-binding protein, partial [bacterium]
AFLFLLLSAIILVLWISKNLPEPDKLLSREVAQSTKIYDRTGEEILYEIHGEEKRTLVKLDEIPDHVKWAVISIEDKDFYHHKGISLWAIARTAFGRVFLGRGGGGSTLTQQFVKNAILTSEQTYIRKIKEAILAYKIEKKYTKDEILQMYLNEIPYGSTAYGVEAASQRFFGKSVRDVNIAEAAVLAAIPQAPSKYSPYGPNKDLLVGRQAYVLDLMNKQGYITEQEAEDFKNYQVEFKKPKENIKAPHFVMLVKEILSDKYGEKMIEQGGLKIITTLDLYKQEIAEEVITAKTNDYEEKYNATNASLVSIDPKTGQVLAMIGSKDYFDEEIDGQVNITTSKRQPGSSMKPLAYATAFLKGYNPNTILFDVSTNFSNNPSEPYAPNNYDLKERGPVSMRQALAGSLNIPAVKTLYLAGINNVLDLAQALGYTTLNDRDRFGLSLVLGGGEVKMIEHINAFSAFAREGEIRPISVILKVEDAQGNVLEEFQDNVKKTLAPKIAREINSILSDNNARAYVFGASNWLTLGNRPVAAKTGTTNDYRDAWTIGYTPSIVTGVWVGNNDNTAMKRGADGSIVAAPIWHDYMQEILGDTPIEYFKSLEIPSTDKLMVGGQTGLEKIVKIDSATGLLATEFTPAESIVEKTFLDPHCILYFVNKNDPLGPLPENPSADSQFNLWETGVLEWAKKQNFATSSPPTETDNIHTPENMPDITIITPVNKEKISTRILISQVEATAPRGINRVEYYLNDILISTNYVYPYGLKTNITFLNNGFHNLKARACDDVNNCYSEEIEFNFNLPNNKNNKQKVSVLLIEPMGGVAISDADFPLPIKLTVDNPTSAGQANFYYIKEEDGATAVLISSVQPIENGTISTNWKNVPPSGSYKIYSEVITWSGEKIKSNEILITVTNNIIGAP